MLIIGSYLFWSNFDLTAVIKTQSFTRNILAGAESYYLGKQDWVKISFQIEVPDLIKQITEDRLKQARAPVHYIESITFMLSL